MDIDLFYLAAHGMQTVNYNRDVEVFPVLARLFEEILGASPYASPTNIDVNMTYQWMDFQARLQAEEDIIK